jgi:hypothetical protein
VSPLKEDAPGRSRKTALPGLNAGTWDTCRRSSKNAVKARAGLLAAARNLEYRPKDQALWQGSSGQWEELVPVVSVFALRGFLAPYAERGPGDDLQAPLPDFPLTAGANSKGFIPDTLQGGLNLSAR